MMNLIRRVVRSFRPSKSLETCMIYGRSFVLVPGTFGNDYDTAWFYAMAKECKVLFDIGSNMGMHSILAFAGGNAQHALLVDANSEALTVASGNLIRNDVAHRASFYKGFVGDTDDEEITFWTAGVGAAGSMFSSHATTARNSSSSFRVRTITIDTLVQVFGLRPDLIKVDVEGAEGRVLLGATQTAKIAAPAFFVEMHALEELSMEENAKQVLLWCAQCDYVAYYLKEHRRLEDASYIKHRGRCHLLLLPEGKPYPSYLKVIRQGDLL